MLWIHISFILILILHMSMYVQFYANSCYVELFLFFHISLYAIILFTNVKRDSNVHIII